jgi:hypothetical protein
MLDETICIYVSDAEAATPEFPTLELTECYWLPQNTQFQVHHPSSTLQYVKHTSRNIPAIHCHTNVNRY